MNKTERKKRLEKIYGLLDREYGPGKCTLDYSGAHELLVATILSAQCKDERVNLVTKTLFKKYGTVTDFASANPSELEKIIQPLGCFRVKAKNIIAACKKIRDEFNGEVPHTMEGLTSLPGFGRKSANVLLGNEFGIPGFPVDTHVIRVLNKIGVVDTKDPVKIEKLVTGSVPDEWWTNFSHIIIYHGRAICHARNPECGKCLIREYCDYGKQTEK
jgi:endonuclease-3